MPYYAYMRPSGLREFLKEEGLAQVQLAMLLEIDPRTVRRYVLGESGIPRVIELACIGLVTLRKEMEKEKRK